MSLATMQHTAGSEKGSVSRCYLLPAKARVPYFLKIFKR
jgi:hypothetical protein